ncbi:hypothetical protein LINGRAHAP2_LOCUS422 [Linum grandiflorum]
MRAIEDELQIALSLGILRINVQSDLMTVIAIMFKRFSLNH